MTPDGEGRADTGYGDDERHGVELYSISPEHMLRSGSGERPWLPGITSACNTR